MNMNPIVTNTIKILEELRDNAWKEAQDDIHLQWVREMLFSKAECLQIAIDAVKEKYDE